MTFAQCAILLFECFVNSSIYAYVLNAHYGRIPLEIDLWAKPPYLRDPSIS